jgi:GNAT superfamily N-acetyltransferase
MAERPARKVLLVAWDCADWEVVTPLLDAGRLPHLERLVDAGVMGRLACGGPLRAPLVATTLATGVRADRHGILTDEQPDPEAGALRPVGTRSRRAPALWDRLDRHGFDAHVVGWPATDAAEAIRGVVVAPGFARAEAPRDRPWPLATGSVRPGRLEATLAGLRLHPGDVPPELLLAFVPGAAEIDQDEDTRLADLAVLLAEAVSLHAAATWVLEAEPWDFLAVHYPATGRASRLFMPYHPPRKPDVPEADFERYRAVLTGIYELHDRMLGRLVELAGPEATVFVVSGYGYHAGDRRPRGPDPFALENPTAWHRSPGLLVAAGPPLRRDELVHGALVLDIAPTVLALFGLPWPAELEGRPLAEAFTTPIELARGPGPVHRNAAEADHAPGHEAEVQPALERLAALGYIDTPAEPERRMLHSNQLERDYILAQVYMDSGRLGIAAALLERLVVAEPREPAFAHTLGACYISLVGRTAGRDALRRTLSHATRRPVCEPPPTRQQSAPGRASGRPTAVGQARDAAAPLLQPTPGPEQGIRRAGVAGGSIGRDDVTIRAPRGRELRACRMLLPEAFRPDIPFAFLLADGGPTRDVVGAVAYAPVVRRAGDRALRFDLRVPRPDRRRGIGRALLDALIVQARQWGVATLVTQHQLLNEPESSAFLRSRGFVAFERMTTVEVELNRLASHVLPLRDRMLAQGRVPRGARVVPLSESRLREVGRLHLAYFGGPPEGLAARLRHALAPRSDTFGRVLMLGNDTAGALFGLLKAEHLEVEAHLLAPDYRHPGALGGWAHALLLGAALDSPEAALVPRARFTFRQDNHSIRRLAERCAARLVSVSDGYQLDLATLRL